MDIPFSTQTQTPQAETGPAGPPATAPAVPAALRDSRDWGFGVPSLAEARDAVGALLSRVRPEPARRVVQDAQLVVSELVTNAIRHAAGPFGLLLELSPEADALRISVADGSPEPPRHRPPDPARVGGHGLRLVTLLCAALEVTPLRRGKRVTATLPLAAPALA